MLDQALLPIALSGSYLSISWFSLWTLSRLKSDVSNSMMPAGETSCSHVLVCRRPPTCLDLLQSKSKPEYEMNR